MSYDWVSIDAKLPDEDCIVECAAISGYDGSAYRVFAMRVVDGDEGWAWYVVKGDWLDDADMAEIDDIEVFAWRNPEPLPPPPKEKPACYGISMVDDYGQEKP